MKTITLTYFVLGILMMSASLIIGVSLMILKYFPTSKVSGFVRRYLITDQDLEPIEGDESQSSTEGTNS
jgi:hypothetical protein